MAEKSNWMYDMFGSTGKAIAKRQQDQCKAQGMTFDKKTRKCVSKGGPKK